MGYETDQLRDTEQEHVVALRPFRGIGQCDL